MTASWRAAPGFEGHYEVSDDGRVRSVDRVITLKNGRTRKKRGVELSPSVDEHGRLGVSLYLDGRQTRRRVHVLVLEAFVGPRPAGMEGCHNNGVVTDNRRTNLRWDTSSENRYDTVRHGHHPNASKQTCPRRHELRVPNLMRPRPGIVARSCLACDRASSAALTAARSGRPYDIGAEADRKYAAIMQETVA